MEPRRPTTTSTPDAFERALRDLLVEQAHRTPPPARLDAMLDEVIAQPRAVRRPPALRWSRTLATLAACLVVIAVTGLVMGFASLPRLASFGPDQGPAIDWDSGSVRLQADAIRITGLGVFTGDPDLVDGSPAIAIGSDPGAPTYRTLEVAWQERGVPMRLFLYLAADDTHWWVTEIRTYDGSPAGAWITYPGPLFRAPLGGTYTGDFQATGQQGAVPGSLRIDGLRLTAFAAGTGPAVLTGCRPWRDGTGAGPGLTPDTLVGMLPGQAAARLRERGVCHEFRWSYRTGNNVGYSERWCVPPPTGRVIAVSFLDDGAALLSVDDDSGLVREVREQPPAGWGCPTDQRAAASQAPRSTSAPGASPSGSPAASGLPPLPVGPSSETVEAEVPATPVP
jgi:hypothetical protein